MKPFILLILFLPFISFAQSDLNQTLLVSSPSAINADPILHQHMLTLANSAINQHCVSCHGPNLKGSPGIPNLVDNDWLWGVTGYETTTVEPVMKIMQTILYGVRDTDCSVTLQRYGSCPDTRFSQMPAYGNLLYSKQQISDLSEYTLNLGGNNADLDAVSRASELWYVCTECHANDGYGFPAFGGPNLTDQIWLYGGDRTAIYDVIFNGRAASCPAWGKMLDAATIKAIAVFLYGESMN